MPWPRKWTCVCSLFDAFAAILQSLRLYLDVSWAWVDVFSVEERKALKKFHELMCLIADIEEDDCWDESDIASRQHWVQQCKQASLTYDLFMERGHRSREDILADRDKISNEEST